MLYLGRKQTWEILHTFAENHKNSCWVHCASLGEFEQGRPLIEKLRINYPNMPMVLSFYSPSGYEIMKHYDRVDAVIYLPSDLPSNNKRLIQLIQPTMVIFVKYEFWWNLLDTLTKQNIKVFLISAVFRKDNYFFTSLLRPFLSILARYNTIYVQDGTSADILTQHNLSNHIMSGDTRIDRVIQRSKSSQVPENIETYCGDQTTLVYGSVWITDMNMVAATIQAFPNMVHIIAPHDISIGNIQKIRASIKETTDIYSDCEWHHKVMIIDNIGMLGGLYHLAKYAYVGGGFQNGIHNILEPAVFKVPVFFGPNFKKFNEAVYLTEQKAAFTIDDPSTMIYHIMRLEKDDGAYLDISDKLSQYFQKSKGATDRIMSDLDSHILNYYKRSE